MVRCNVRKGHDLIHLDDLLVPFKMDPEVLEIPIPNYFKEDDRVPIDIKFKEPIGDKKKKKKKKGKKKKVKDDKDKKKEETKSLVEKQQLMDKYLEDVYETAEPEEEEVTDPYTLDMDFVHAIRLIQKNERGRQYRQRLLQILVMHRKKKIEAERKKRIMEGLDQEPSDEQVEKKASIFLQKRLRGMLARKYLEKMRQEELIFLGMARKEKTAEELENDSEKVKKQTEERRKLTQKEHMEDYEKSLQDIEQIVKLNEEPDIRDKMLEERRQWAVKYQQEKGKKPKSVAEFYKKFEVAKPLTAEEEEKQRLEDEETKKNKKKKKKEAGGKGKKKKKGNKEKDPSAGFVNVGPSEIVRKFEEFAVGKQDKWDKKDETDNFAQNYDTEMVKDLVRPNVEKQIEKTVDSMIEIELDNYRKGKKGKKAKKKKKKKGKKKAKRPFPGEKVIRDRKIDDLLGELVDAGIAKKLPPARIKSFYGDYNLLGSVQNDPLEIAPAPSPAQLRQMITEYAIFPLGSSLVRSRIPKVPQSMLFFGPPGSGKTMMARAVAYETASLLLDISPHAIENKYTDRKGEERLIATVMNVALAFQPSVIYMDECELVFPKKGKKKGKKGKKKGSKKGPNRIAKMLLKYKKGWLKSMMRILIIGCTTAPHEAAGPDVKRMFEKRFFFSYPTYSNSRIIWRKMIEENGGIIKEDFPLSTLAHISEGYTVGSIKQTCEKVLTEHRKKSVIYFYLLQIIHSYSFTA